MILFINTGDINKLTHFSIKMQLINSQCFQCSYRQPTQAYNVD